MKDVEGSKKIDNNSLQRLMNNFPRIDSLLDDISKKMIRHIYLILFFIYIIMKNGF